MTTPSSASGTGGAWQNQTYGTETSQSLFTPNQQFLLPIGGSFSPTPIGLSAPMGGSGKYSALQVLNVSAFSAYEITASLAATSGALVAGQIAQIDVYWFDNLGDFTPIEHIRFEGPSNNVILSPTNGANIWGHGPMAGQWMAIQFTNKTGGAAIAGYFSFTGTTRNWNSHDWRGDSIQSSQTGSAATPYTNELCMISGSNVPANGVITRGCFLYSGQAYLMGANIATGGTLLVTIGDSDGLLVAEIHPTIGGSDFVAGFNMPRKLCNVQVNNSSASAAGTISLALIGDRI